MAELLTPDICVIGAGSGGLSVAAAAAAFGVPVVLVEKDKMGGDCLNTGCVPSKSLLAAAKRARAMAQARHFGLAAPPVEVDFAKVHRHVHDVIAAIAPNRLHGALHRSRRAGDRRDGTLPRCGHGGRRRRHRDQGPALRDRHRFFADAATDPRPQGHARISPTRQCSISPRVPIISLSSARVRSVLSSPRHSAGSAPGSPCWRPHSRWRAKIPNAPPSCSTNWRAKISPFAAACPSSGSRAQGRACAWSSAALRGEEAIEGSHLLVATGRRANVDDLGLDRAGISYDGKGVRVDRHLRTANRRVYAIGDAAGGPQFTHVANYHAGLVIRNALFRLRPKVNEDAIPRVTFTDPELAQVGLTEAEARRRGYGIQVLRWPYHENDRAQAERETSRSYQGGNHPAGPNPGGHHCGGRSRRVDHDLDARDQPQSQRSRR